MTLIKFILFAAAIGATVCRAGSNHDNALWEARMRRTTGSPTSSDEDVSPHYQTSQRQGMYGSRAGQSASSQYFTMHEDGGVMYPDMDARRGREMPSLYSSSARTPYDSSPSSSPDPFVSMYQANGVAAQSTPRMGRPRRGPTQPRTTALLLRSRQRQQDHIDSMMQQMEHLGLESSSSSISGYELPPSGRPQRRRRGRGGESADSIPFEASSSHGQQYDQLGVDRRESTAEPELTIEGAIPFEIRRDFERMWEVHQLSFDEMEPKQLAIIVADYAMARGHVEDILTLALHKATLGYEHRSQLEDFIGWSTQCQKAIQYFRDRSRPFDSAGEALRRYTRYQEQVREHRLSRGREQHDMK